MSADKQALIVQVDPESHQTRGAATAFHNVAKVRGAQSKGGVGNGGKLLSHETSRDKTRELFCIVVRVDKGGHFKTQEEVDEFRKTLINDLIAAGLDLAPFYSIEEDSIFIKIGATDTRLLEEADREEFVLHLDAEAMRTIAESDKGLPERKPIHLEAPYDRNQQIQKLDIMGWRDMTDSEVDHFIHKETHIGPFQHLHAKYNDEWEKYGKDNFGVQLYKVYKNGTLLRTGDRIKLIKIILERSRIPDPVTGSRGAGLDLKKLELDEKILASFPLQNALDTGDSAEPTVDELFSKWNSLFKLPWSQPIEEIRDYYGEKIAMYFAFLGHYTQWLFVAGIVGLAIFIHQLINIEQGTGSANFLAATQVVNVSGVPEVIVYTEVPEVSFYAIFVVLWGTFMLSFWKRSEARHALRWGTSNFERTEVVRPEFVPSHIVPSPVTGISQPYYSYRSFLMRLIVSISIVAISIGVVISTIASIFVFKVFISLPTSTNATGLNQTTSTYVGLIINAVVIIILGKIYRKIALMLTHWENHRTETHFEDALIAKSFVFTFCNSYATLFYMAFIKSGTVILGQLQLCRPGPVQYGAIDDCFGVLGSSLLIIFILQLVLTNALELGIPWISENISYCQESRKKKKLREQDEEFQVKIRSPCEDEFFKQTYEGPFDDYLKLALQFGYVTLFVSAFPLAPFLAFINSQVEIHIVSIKICKLSRRPVNSGTQDIGTWATVFYFIGFVSILTNAGVIFFTSHLIVIPASVSGISPEAFRVWMWVVSVAAVVILKLFFDFMVPAVPQDVTIQLDRQEFLVRKCLLREIDDEDTDPSRKAKVDKSTEVSVEISKIDPVMEAACIDLARAIVQSSHNLEEEFKQNDYGGKGLISVKTFTKLIKEHESVQGQYTDEEVQSIIECLDYNSNNKIDYREFLRLGKN